MAGMEALSVLLTNLGQSTIDFLPNLIGALILLLLGYVVGKVVGIVIEKICISAKVDKYIKSKGFKLSYLFKVAGAWIIYLLAIQAAFQYLGIMALATFVDKIVNFIPMAVGAAIIIIVGYVLGNFFEEQIKVSEGKYSSLIGRIVNFFTVYVAIALALPFIGINPSLVNNILLVIIGSVGLGFAIAMGLGLKDIVAKEAEKYVGSIEKSFAKKKK